MKKFAFYLAIGILLGLSMLGIFAPHFSTLDPNLIDLDLMKTAPNKMFWLGSDFFGRDIFSRILYGLRVSLIVGVAAASFACFIGVVWAMICIIMPSFIDTALMRVVDGFLALPIILFIMFFSTILEPGLFNMIIIIAFSTWMQTARVMRSEYEKISSQEFVAAAIVLGSSKVRIVFKEILPNCMGILLVLFTINFAHAIATEAVLSFFGIGIALGEASLGNMLNDASVAIFAKAWWIVIFPGVVVFLLVVSALYISDFISGKRGLNI